MSADSPVSRRRRRPVSPALGSHLKVSYAMNPLPTLLAFSLAINALFGYAYLNQRDTATVAKVEQRQAVGVATKCSEGTEKLAAKAGQREAAAKPKRKAAADKAREHETQAQQILSTPPAGPGNACASAQAELDNWWERRKP